MTYDFFKGNMDALVVLGLRHMNELLALAEKSHSELKAEMELLTHAMEQQIEEHGDISKDWDR